MENLGGEMAALSKPSCWANLAWLLAGIKNSPKNLCSHVAFSLFSLYYK
jgi:hypothetical protein